MKLMIRLLILTVVAGAFLTLSGCEDSKQQMKPVAKGGLIGAAAPDFSLLDMQGNKVTLSQFKGKVVIINFWATWCPPCREEMPSMEKLYRRFADKGLVMLALNVEDDGKELVADFLKKTPYSFPILLDEDQSVQETYGVFRFPESFIIDRNGQVVERIVGARDWLSGPTFKLIDFLVNG